jgi:hypothetical protein
MRSGDFPTKFHIHFEFSALIFKEIVPRKSPNRGQPIAWDQAELESCGSPVVELW